MIDLIQSGLLFIAALVGFWAFVLAYKLATTSPTAYERNRAQLNGFWKNFWGENCAAPDGSSLVEEGFVYSYKDKRIIQNSRLSESCVREIIE